MSEPKVEHLAVGEWGEGVATEALKQAGLLILASRIRFGPREELDIVARDGETLVFVEVKTRRGETFGRPADFEDRKKRQVLSRAAVRYLARTPSPRVSFRFDVIEIVGAPGDEPEIRHIENAFSLDRRYMLPC